MSAVQFPARGALARAMPFARVARAVTVVFTGYLLGACLSAAHEPPEERAAAASEDALASTSQALITPPKPVSAYERAGCIGYGVTNSLFGSKLVTVDPRNTTSAAVGTAYLTYNLTGLAVDPQTRKLYAVDLSSLYQVDPGSGQVTRIGAINLLLGPVKGLEFAPDGQLYTWSALGGLTRVDKSTGRGTKVFGSLLPALLGIDAFAFSADGARIYVAKFDRLYAVNPANGQATLLSGRLPSLVSALHARSDGRLVLVPKQAIALGYELLLFDPTPGVWSTVTTYGVIPKSQLACGGFNAFTWPRGCGSFTSGGRAPLIKNVALSATTVCSGDSVDVDVTAVHPERPAEQAHVSVDSLPGNHHRLQLVGAGPHTVTITAQTGDGYVDSETATVSVQECTRSIAVPELRVTGNVFMQDGADLTVLNREDYSASASFAWSFGDGQTSTTQVPYVAHSYALSLSGSQRFQVFSVSVTVSDGGRTATAQKTLSVWNSYVIDREDHRTLRPPVFAPAEFEEDAGALSAQYALVNLEGHALQLTRKYVEFVPCDPALSPSVSPAQDVSVTVPANSFYVGTESTSLSAIPDGICKLGLHLRGLDGDKLVQVDSYLRVPSRRTWNVVTSPALRDLFLRIRDNGWAENEAQITGADLRRLVLEGRLTRAEVDAALAATGAAPQLAEARCVPGDVHPTNPNLTCQQTTDMEMTHPGSEVANASKGDLLLVSACGLVSAALRNVQPEQLYTHEGIMTRNRVEITHVTLAEERLAEEDYLEGLQGKDGPRRGVLKFGEPGARVLSVDEAFHGYDYIDDDGHPYRLQHFSSEPLRCVGDTAIIRPKVVKPPIDAPVSVREKLFLAADKAVELVGEAPHYRLFAFSEGNIPWRDEFKHEGRPAAVSSVFLWWAIKRAEWDEGVDIPLEGCSLDRSGTLPRWNCGDGDIERGEFEANGAEVDEQTWDGLYLYRADERRQGLEAIRTFVQRGVYAKKGWLAKFVGADDNFSDKVVNCFAFDVCSETKSCSSCGSPACCTPQETLFNNMNPDPRSDISCVANCNWDFDLLARGATEGHTVSPDDFLKWDQPAGTLGAGDGENGVYGSSEYLDYEDLTARWIYRWRPSQGFGQVSGHVFLEEGSCSVDADCDAGGLCLDAHCRRPAENVEVIFSALGADQARVTDSQGFYEYQTAPAGVYLLTAQHQVDGPDGPRVYAGSVTALVPNQGTLTDLDIILRRKANPDERIVTVTGKTELIDCDCAGGNETRIHNLFGTCRVSPRHLTDTFEQPQSELCADEVGLKFSGECELRADGLVHVTLRGSFFEGREQSCGGDEREARFTREVEVAAEASTPVEITRLLHNDWCYYGLWAQRCDNKAFFRNVVITNAVAEL